MELYRRRRLETVDSKEVSTFERRTTKQSVMRIATMLCAFGFQQESIYVQSDEEAQPDSVHVEAR